MQPFSSRSSASIQDEECYCSAPQEVGDILCPGSDTEDTPEEIKEKRARYEMHAQRYLRGHMPTINSAKLRGPFDDGWINPWAYRPHKSRGGHSANGLPLPRGNAIKKTVDRGRKKVSPANAMASSRAEAEARPVREINTVKEANSISLLREESSLKALVDKAELEEDATNFEDVDDVEHHFQYKSPPDHDTSFNSETTLPTRQRGAPPTDDIRSSSRVADGFPSIEPMASKRPMDSLWLRGSYPSKRARWDSPAAISPSPVPLQREMPVRKLPRRHSKPILSNRTPFHPVSYPRTPGTTWSQDGQNRHLSRWGSEQEAIRATNLRLSLDNGMRNLPNTALSSAKNNTNTTRWPPNTTNTQERTILPPTSHNTSSSDYNNLNTPNTNSYGLSSVATGMISNRSPKSTSTSASDEDVTFVTDVAPSSRNLEKFEFRKKQKRKNRSSVDAEKIDCAPHPPPLTVTSLQSVAEKELRNVAKTSVDFRKIIFVESYSDGTGTSSIKMKHLRSVKQFEKIPVGKAQHRWETLQPKKRATNGPLKSLTNITPHHVRSPQAILLLPPIDMPTTQVNTSPRSSDINTSSHIKSLSRICSKSSPSMSHLFVEPVEEAPSNSPGHENELARALRKDNLISSLPLKTPVELPTSLFSLDTPAKLSPFAIKFYQNGESFRATGEDGLSETTGAGTSVPSDAMKSSNSPHKMLHTSDGIRPRRSTCRRGSFLSKSQESQSAIFTLYPTANPTLIPGSSSSFPLVNAEPGEFLRVNYIGLECDEDSLTPTRVGDSVPLKCRSLKSPTPRRTLPEHQALSALKVRHGGSMRDDDSTQSWNSTQPTSSDAPIMSCVQEHGADENGCSPFKSPSRDVNVRAVLKLVSRSPSITTYLDANSPDVPEVIMNEVATELGMVRRSENVSRQKGSTDQTPSQTFVTTEDGLVGVPLDQHDISKSRSNSPDVSVDDNYIVEESTAVVVVDVVRSVEDNDNSTESVNVSKDTEDLVDTHLKPDTDQTTLEGRGSQNPQSPWTNSDGFPSLTVTVANPVHLQSFGTIELLPSWDNIPVHVKEDDVGWLTKTSRVNSERSVSLDRLQTKNESEWQSQISQKEPVIEGDDVGSHERPSTPTSELAGIIPFANFMTPTPSPDQSDLPIDGELPNTQQIIEAATKNPWTSALKKTSTKKSPKRVSFGLLPSERRAGSEIEGSPAPGYRPVSPPPPNFVEYSEEEDIFNDGRTSLRTFESHFLAPDGVGGYRPTMRHSPLKPLTSPVVGGMAEAFLAADREGLRDRVQHSTLDQTPSRHSKGQSHSRTSSPSSTNKLLSTEPIFSRPRAGKTPHSKTSDYTYDAENDILNEFLGEGGVLEEWSVETELKMTSSAMSETDRLNTGSSRRRNMFGGLSNGW